MKQFILGLGVTGLLSILAVLPASDQAQRWPVGEWDLASRMPARCFELQARGRPAEAALREAQLEAVRRRPEKNAAAHPFFWAAYTVTGRPSSRQP